MTDNLKKMAAVIMAITDRISHGAAANPSGYWGVAPIEAAHALDAMIGKLDIEELGQVLDLLTGEGK